MSFLAKLFFQGAHAPSGSDGEEGFKVLDFSIEFNVDTDKRGRRLSRLTGGRISLVIESNKKGEFLMWAENPDENRDGEIIFYKSDMQAVERKFFFGIGDCVYYAEEFHADKKVPMLTRLTIAAFVIAIDGVEVKLWDEMKNV